VLVLLFGAVGLAISTIAIAQALDRETKRVQEAEQRFRLARRSADDMIQLAEVEMADNPALQNLRRQLLEIALIYYQELIELRGDDPESQAELAVTRDQVKRILSDLAVLQGAAHLFMLRHPDVLNDLKLQGEDRKRVSDLVYRLEKQHQDSSREFHKLAQEERQKHFVAMAQSNEAALAEVLTPVQTRRLRQIALQCQGPMAFRDPQVVAALKLSPDQRKQIRGVESIFFFEKKDHDKKDHDRPGPPKGPKKGFDKGFGGFDKGFGGFDDKRFEERRNAAMRQISEVLTMDQNKQWQQMIGEPFYSKMPIYLFGAPMPMMSGFGPPPPPDGFGPPRKKDFKDRK
jgi:hypothetical protein